jgi:hypothetical protein
MTEPISEGLTPEKPTFNYLEVQKKLYDQVKDNSFQLAVEKFVNWSSEAVGVRKKEAKLVNKGENQRILLENEKGEVLDPAELSDHKDESKSNSQPLTTIIVDEGPESGRTIVSKGELFLPKPWVDGRPHQGMRVLHEVAHNLVFRENPAYQHIVDELRIQKMAAELMATSSEMPMGDINEFILGSIDAKLISNLGINEPEGLKAHIGKIVSDTNRIFNEGPEVFEDYYGQLALTEYEVTAQRERNVWAKTLKMMRLAKEKGFVIDNRSPDKIFDQVDISLASRVLPNWTNIVKRKSFRKRFGLPDQVEEKPRLASMPLEVAVAKLESAQRFRDAVSDSVREYLGHNLGDVLRNETTITPISQADSQIIKPRDWLLGKSEGIKIDRRTETLVKLALGVYNKIHTEREEKLMSLRGITESDEDGRWKPEGGVKIVDNINISADGHGSKQYSVSFNTTNVGGGHFKSRIESNLMFIREGRSDLDDDIAPAYQTSREMYLFANRVTPEKGQKVTGLQIIGEIMDIRGEAIRWARENGIEKNQVAEYVKSQGYDQETVGSILLGDTGRFAGHIRENQS